MYTKFKELLDSKERNRKKKKYFPEYYLSRNYLPEQSTKLAFKHFNNTMLDGEIRMMTISSGWSIAFWLIRGYTEEEAKLKVIEIQRNNGKRKIAKYSVEELRLQSKRCSEYWVALGYYKEDAKLKVSEYQTTFTLDKLIEKHGEVEGFKIWEARQVKWQTTMNNKSKEEIDEINVKRNIFNLDNLIRIHGGEVGPIKYKENMLRASMLSSTSKCSTSKSSIKFFDKLEKKLNREYGISGLESKYGNKGEFSIKRDNLNQVFLYDYTIENLKIIIEYHGEMWHPKQGQYDWVSPLNETYETKYNRDQEKKQLAISKGFIFYEYFSRTKVKDTIAFLNEISEEIKGRYENYKNKTVKSV